MNIKIGFEMGSVLASFEKDFKDNPDDLETLQKIDLLTRSYRNLAEGGMDGFKEDFEAGYARGRQIMGMDYQNEATGPAVSLREGPPFG